MANKAMLLLFFVVICLVSRASVVAAVDFNEEFGDPSEDQGEYIDDGLEDDAVVGDDGVEVEGDFDDQDFSAESEGEEEYDDSDVLKLVTANFSATIDNAEFALVAFTASWCGHCMDLAPKYARAATILKNDGVPVVLAKVDAEEDKELAKKYDVEGFPTIYFFVRGQAKPYSGGRQTEDLVSWLRKKTGPPSSLLMAVDKAKAAMDQEKVLAVGYFEKLDGSFWDAFQEVAQELDMSFVHTTLSEVAVEFGLPKKAPAVAIIKKAEEKFVLFDGKQNKESLSTFLNNNKFALVTLFGTDDAEKVFESDVKVQVILLSSGKDLDKRKPVYEEAAKAFKGQAAFIHVDTELEQDAKGVTDFFGLEEGETYEVMAFASEKGGGRYRLTGPVTADSIKTFVKGIITKTLKPHVRSEPLPEKNDEAVKVVVGKNFEDIVMDKKKDVLLEVYAPWCGHCQALEPTYKKLAEKFADVKSVVIAKMDGTKNDHDSLQVEGFPTILLFPANNKTEPIILEDGRAIKALATFIQDHASIPFTMPKFSKEDEEEPQMPQDAEVDEMDPPENFEYDEGEGDAEEFDEDVKDEL